MAEQGIREGSTIHVFQKQDEEVINDEPITEEQIQKAVNSYRSVIKDAGNSLAVSFIVFFLIYYILVPIVLQTAIAEHFGLQILN